MSQICCKFFLRMTVVTQKEKHAITRAETCEQVEDSCVFLHRAAPQEYEHAVALLFCSVRLSRTALLRNRLCAQAFTEVRKYPVKPGKMDEWVRIMEDMIIP